VDRASPDRLSGRQAPASPTPWLGAGRLLFAALAVLVFVADRVTKGMVVANVAPGTERAALPHVWITNTQNSGAAFGVAQEGTVFFLVASIVVAVGVIFYAFRNHLDAWTGALLGLILGGTVGNAYDRFLHGTVTDFIALHFWPVFNVADSAISVGVALLLVGYVLRHRSAVSA
jgi:signal peptidase II